MINATENAQQIEGHNPQFFTFIFISVALRGKPISPSQISSRIKLARPKRPAPRSRSFLAMPHIQVDGWILWLQMKSSPGVRWILCHSQSTPADPSIGSASDTTNPNYPRLSADSSLKGQLWNATGASTKIHIVLSTIVSGSIIESLFSRHAMDRCQQRLKKPRMKRSWWNPNKWRQITIRATQRILNLQYREQLREAETVRKRYSTEEEVKSPLREKRRTMVSMSRFGFVAVPHRSRENAVEESGPYQ
jgi:hypothetical protein